MEVLSQYFGYFVVLFLLVLGYLCGRIAERRHYRSIISREDRFSDVIVVTSKTVPALETAPRIRLVGGNVVISVDYFKRFVAKLRMIFGGRIHTYESLLDRARREAILRMQEQASDLGARMIFNTRFETSSISKGKDQTIGSFEVLVYGTAIIL